ncbi:hypothetical protein FQN50_008509 [Emmonsiellopsis sp. PD_5]|nr:hypothetical protein FQN50_008509 [Emmonsiellopsis sp. PD_5]
MPPSSEKSSHFRLTERLPPALPPSRKTQAGGLNKKKKYVSGSWTIQWLEADMGSIKTSSTPSTSDESSSSGLPCYKILSDPDFK